jgi:hypothetical protein
MSPTLVTIGCRDGAIALPGLRTNSLTYEVAKLLEKGWRVHVRGPKILFEAPPAANGKRLVYQEAATKYILGWSFDTDEELSQTDKWSSGMPTTRQTPVTQPTARPGDEDELDDDVPVDTVQKGKRR